MIEEVYHSTDVTTCCRTISYSSNHCTGTMYGRGVKLNLIAGRISIMAVVKQPVVSVTPDVWSTPPPPSDVKRPPTIRRQKKTLTVLLLGRSWGAELRSRKCSLEKSQRTAGVC